MKNLFHWKKGVNEVIKNEATEQKDGFFSMLLRALGASLLGNVVVMKDGEGAIANMIDDIK